MNDTERLTEITDIEWSYEAIIDELQRDLASVEIVVTNQSGQKLVIRKYQSQCRRLARLIPIAEPVPEYIVEASDLKPDVRQRLLKIHHSKIKLQLLHQAVLRLFESIGIDPYIIIGRRLVVKLNGDETNVWQ